jgi:hypothetical protein
MGYRRWEVSGSGSGATPSEDVALLYLLVTVYRRRCVYQSRATPSIEVALLMQ